MDDYIGMGEYNDGRVYGEHRDGGVYRDGEYKGGGVQRWGNIEMGVYG